jgi:hypothetical protein
MKKASPVSEHEVLDAARVLETNPKNRVARYRDAALTGAVGKPLVHVMGRGARAAATAAPGSRLRAAVKGMASVNKADIAQHVTEGAVGGSAIRAAQEGMEVGRAKKKIHSFLNEKTAAEAFKGNIQQLSDRVRKQKLPPIASPDFDFEV